MVHSRETLKDRKIGFLRELDSTEIRDRQIALGEKGVRRNQKAQGKMRYIGEFL